MSYNSRKVQQGYQVSSSAASSQFRDGNNAAMNALAATKRAMDATTPEGISKALHSSAKAHERSGWEQERLYQQQKKDMWLGR